MKKISIFLIMLLLVPMLTVATAEREKDIHLNTGGPIGHLVYGEQYYSVNSSGNGTLEDSRIYFDGNINESNIIFTIMRPVDKNGNQYPETLVRGIATLNNQTILDTWYDVVVVTTPSKDIISHNNDSIIGLLILLSIILVIIVIIVKKIRRKPK